MCYKIPATSEDAEERLRECRSSSTETARTVRPERDHAEHGTLESKTGFAFMLRWLFGPSRNESLARKEVASAGMRKDKLKDKQRDTQNDKQETETVS